MASGKDSVRDMRYGRRGGRWADGEAGTDRLAAIHAIRMTALRADALGVDDESKRQWPAASVAVWRDIAENYPNHPAHAWALEVIAVAGG